MEFQQFIRYVPHYSGLIQDFLLGRGKNESQYSWRSDIVHVIIEVVQGFIMWERMISEQMYLNMQQHLS